MNLSLPDHIYGCIWFDSIILLDLIANDYVILNNKEKKHLELLLSNNKNSKYDRENKFDAELLSKLKKQIFLSTTENKKQKSIHHKTCRINIFNWQEKINNLKIRYSLRLVFEALITYVKIFIMLSLNKGFYLLIKNVKNYHKSEAKVFPSQESLLSLINAVNIARLLFPFNTRCLHWAFCLYFMGRKRSWPFSFIVGILNNPFWSHAWVDLNGMALSDELFVPEGLKILLKEPVKLE